MLFAVLSFASCEEENEDQEPTFSTYFKMSYNKFLNKINEDLNIYAQNSA